MSVHGEREMSRFRAKLILWWNGYCTKHLCPKTDEIGYTYDELGPAAILGCGKCKAEEDRRTQERISAAQNRLTQLCEDLRKCSHQ